MRNGISTHTVALLATGDEIIQGDIQNTNSQQIALRLMNHNIPVGMHMSVGDNIANIETTMQFLLQHHRALIITGGLGPTSDDLTRYALSKVVKLPLVFDTTTWEYICQRLQRFGYHTPPESNRQQALFPETATIIPNSNGTAAGCWMSFNKQLIFMLPGPPSECLPMVDEVVLPTLAKAGFEQPLYREKWLLLGASEGKIAEELDEIAKNFDCTTGYRLCYPYLEFKILTKDQPTLTTVVPIIEKTIKNYLIGNGKQTASEQVMPLIQKYHGTLGICDLATGGLLENIIKTPATTKHLVFSKQVTDFQGSSYLQISGLEEYWQGNTTANQTMIHLEIHHAATEKISAKLPLRGPLIKLYAVEWICQQLLAVMFK